MSQLVKPHTLFTSFDIELFSSGHHTQLYNKLGSHVLDLEGNYGVYFAVYAPGASRVEVIGNFNYWNGEKHALNVVVGCVGNFKVKNIRISNTAYFVVIIC